MYAMRIVSLAVASLAALSSAVGAATNQTGAIKTLNVDKHEIVLDDGKTFEAPAVDLKSFKVGEKVQITYDAKDGKMVATKVEVAK